MPNIWRKNETKEVRQEREDRWALSLHAHKVLAMPQHEAQQYLVKWERNNDPQLRKEVRRIYMENI
ncbi:MAG: hypothetical protein HOE82_03585 [Gammaproteobacteria bacterium]|jgi:hypothetical protein|nr:hypothetical protein [Gammaproteobacteria bacterium]